MIETLSGAVQEIVGLRVVTASHAADLREFGFDDKTWSDGKKPRWILHLNCPWRLEGPSGILTGRSDWFDTAEPNADVGPDWDPAQGGSLQESRLRELFQDFSGHRGQLLNRRELIVTGAASDDLGGLLINLTGGYRLVAFPAGTRREFWRLFRGGSAEEGDHFVSEAE